MSTVCVTSKGQHVAGERLVGAKKVVPLLVVAAKKAAPLLVGGCAANPHPR
jgi:hypothetical protein